MFLFYYESSHYEHVIFNNYTRTVLIVNIINQ